MAAPEAAGNAGGSPQHTQNPADSQTAGLLKLREQFPDSQIQPLPKIWCGACSKSPQKECGQHKKAKCRDCGNNITTAHLHLDYVGHAELTARLLDADLLWDWEPIALGQDGLPKFDNNNGLWIRLTVCGHSRLGYGDAQGKTGPNAIKEAIGDALRNAAMRFGAALDLWAKSDLREAEAEKKGSEVHPAEVFVAQLRDAKVWQNPTALATLWQQVTAAKQDRYQVPGANGQTLDQVVTEQIAALEREAAARQQRQAEQAPAAAAEVAANHGVQPPQQGDKQRAVAEMRAKVERGWNNADATAQNLAEANTKGLMNEQVPGPDGQMYAIGHLLTGRLAELRSHQSATVAADTAANRIPSQQQKGAA